MAFLSKLFGAKQTESNRQSSHHIAKPSSDVKSRCQTLKKTNDIGALLTACANESNHMVVECADMRLRELLSQVDNHQLIEQLSDASLSLLTLKHLATQAASIELRQFCVNRLADDDALAEVVNHTDDLSVKVLAAQKVSDIDTLQSLLKQYKGKQKNVYRAIKDRLGIIRSQQSDVAQLQHYADTVQQQITQSSLTTSAVSQFEQQLQSAGQYLLGNEQVTLSKQLAEAKEQLAYVEQAKNERQSVLNVLSQLEEQLQTQQFKGKKSHFTTLVNQVQQDWAQSSVWQSAEAKSFNIRFEQALNAVNHTAKSYFDEQHSQYSQQKLLNQSQHWLDDDVFVTETMLKDQQARWASLAPINDGDLQAKFTDDFSHIMIKLKEKSQRQIHQQSENDELAPTLINQMCEYIESGEVQQALQAQQSIRDLLRSEAGLSKALHRKVISDFKQLESQLTDLTQWQHFGNDQVRHEMIEEMQLLADNLSLSIELKAEQIQVLQTRWKAVKGHAPNALWKTFKETADRAWAPCDAYFKEQRQSSKVLLQKRLDFLTEAEQHINEVNWANPDWQKIIEAHKQFDKIWREFPQLQEHDYRKAKTAYRKVSKLWDSHLDEERKRERQRREKLIQSAELLAESEDTQSAIEEIKTIQRQWSPTVQLKRRAQEQALWKRFQSACDAVFTKHHAQREEKRSEHQTALAKYQQQLDDMALLLKQDIPLFDKQSQFNTQLVALNDFEQVPKSSQATLSKQLVLLQRELNAIQTNEQQQQRQHHLALLKQKDVLCTTLETQLLNADELENVLSEWQTHAFELSEGCADIEKRFKLAVSAQQSGELISPSTDGIDKAQEMCLILELGGDLPSPDYAQPDREKLRLAYLDAAMNGDKSFAQHTTPVGLYQLQINWSLLPKGELNADNQVSLSDWQARFDKAMQANLSP